MDFCVVVLNVQAVGISAAVVILTLLWTRFHEPLSQTVFSYVGYRLGSLSTCWGQVTLVHRLSRVFVRGE